MLHTFWKSRIFPLFNTKDPKMVIPTIRKLYNELVRKHLDPQVKQRWTKRSIYEHILYHEANTENMLTQGIRDVGMIMQKAKSEMSLWSNGQETLNVDAAKIFLSSVHLLDKLNNSRKKAKGGSFK